MTLYAAVVAFIVLFLVIPAWLRMRREDARARALREKALAEGTHEPLSIRPFIDPSRCLGSGACVTACPEQDVLRVIDGQARIVLGSHCVGHGACVASCPVDAITLVFGSERRGVDLPDIGPDFQTNVPGLYIAGELGGMGLVANACEQGIEAMRYLAKTLPRQRGERIDVVIVGAGPAGFAAALAARDQGLSYVLLDQEAFGGAMRHYPRQKLIMSRPMDLPGYGKVRLSSARKEELIALFEEIATRVGLRIDAPERVDAVHLEDGGFRVVTVKRSLAAHRVLLAVGRRGTPRRLGVPGEELEKVAYRLIDPELYRHQHLLVVGGGDSAVEAACALSEQEGNRVTLAYRGEVLSRPKPANQERMNAAVAAGRARILFGADVRRVDVDRVVLDQRGLEVVLPNDYVFVFAGGILPTGFLERAGIRVRTHFGSRVVDRPPAS